MKFCRLKSTPYLYAVLAIFILSLGALTTVQAPNSIASANLESPLDTFTSQASSTPEVETKETDSINLQNSLQGYWRFDDPVVSRGYSLEFDGADDLVEHNMQIDQDDFSDNYTVTAWFQSDEICQMDQGILGQDNGGYDFFLEVSRDNCGELMVAVGEDRKILSAGTLKTGKWYFIAVKLAGQKVYYSLDGGPWQDSGANRTNYDASHESILTAGSISYDNLGETFDGSIDGVRIYNRSLSSTEIRGLYEERPISAEKLYLYQDFNDGPGNCDLTLGNACLTDNAQHNNSGIPKNFDDNNLATGSGWIQETPINRPKVKDYSKKAYTGTLYGLKAESLSNFNYNSSSGWVEGRIDEFALIFDGRDDYIFAGRNIVPKNSYTKSAWVKTSDSSAKNIMSGDSGEHVLYLNNGKIQASNTWGSPKVEATANFHDGKWHNIVFTYDGSQGKIYMDGELLATNSLPEIPDGTRTNIGRYNSGNYFSGSMDDLRIYSRPLSESEIRSLYKRKGVFEDLIYRWNFESGDRETAYDTSELVKNGIFSTRGVRLQNNSRIKLDFSLSSENLSFSGWVNPEPGEVYDLTSSGYVRKQFIGMKWQGGNTDCVSDSPFDPSRIEPDEGARYGLKDTSFWKVVNTSLNSTQGQYSDYIVDFDSVWGSDASNSEAYIGSYVYSPDMRTVNFSVGSDDTRKIWVNGELVHKECDDQGLTVDDSTFSQKLQEGWNKVIMMVNEDSGGWGGQWRISANNQNLKSTANPKAVVSGSSIKLTVKGNSLSAFYGNETISFPFDEGWNFVGITGSSEGLFFKLNDLKESEEDISRGSDREIIIGRNFTGGLDELRIYNRSLSRNEIQRLAFQ